MPAHSKKGFESGGWARPGSDSPLPGGFALRQREDDVSIIPQAKLSFGRSAVYGDGRNGIGRTVRDDD